MSAVPIWIQILQALLTPTIALAVGLIAFMQWRTSHQKVVLDLFDRRLAIYHTVRDAIDAISSQGTVRPESIQKFVKAYEAASFLFGKDVCDYIDRLYLLALLWHIFSR